MAADALVAVALLAGFCVLFYGPWQDACTDSIRQFIFERRDQLFDMAADGHLQFDSMEYRVLRHSLESQIRFAHDFNLPTMFRTIYMMADHRVEVSGPTTEEAINAIKDVGLRRKVKALMNDCGMALVVMAFLKSLLFAPVLALIVFAAVCTRSVVRLLRILEGSKKISNVAEAVQRSALHA